MFSDLRGINDMPPAAPRLKLIKGSHIVVPRIAGADNAFILQNDDGRIVFALPYEETFTLVGTTDIAYQGDPAAVRIEESEIFYLLAVLHRYFKDAPGRDDVVWSYSGVRPLFDDVGSDVKPAQALSRDYRIDFANGPSMPPLLTVLGGKITTYRTLAEMAMQALTPQFPGIGRAWTATARLPGGEIADGDVEGFLRTLGQTYPGLDGAYLRRLFRRHGALAADVLGDTRTPSDLGRDLGAGLFEREVAYLKASEWARTPDDVLWRRTKAGLHLTAAQCRQAAELIETIP